MACVLVMAPEVRAWLHGLQRYEDYLIQEDIR